MPWVKEHTSAQVHQPHIVGVDAVSRCGDEADAGGCVGQMMTGWVVVVLLRVLWRWWWPKQVVWEQTQARQLAVTNSVCPFSAGLCQHYCDEGDMR